MRIVTYFFLVSLFNGLVIPVDKVDVVTRFLLVMVGKDSQTREKQQEQGQAHAHSNIEGGVVSLIIVNVRDNQLKIVNMSGQCQAQLI